ncbi:MAG: 6-bladed beta-propeller [Chloroflexota bacterium]
MAEPQLFHCPTCGAALTLPEDDQAAVRCEYCGSSVLVPAEHRRQKEPLPLPNFSYAGEQPPLVINLGDQPAYAAKASRSLIGSLVLWLVMSVVICSIIGVVLSISGVFGAVEVVNQIVGQAGGVSGMATAGAGIDVSALQTEILTALPPDLLTTPISDQGVQLQLSFGAAGNGPGQFDDTRYLAVAPNGEIFAAGYQDGRVQKFSPDGQFQMLISVPPDDQGYQTISDMTADASGKLYLTRRGDILVYNMADGALLETFPGRFGDYSYGLLAVDQFGSLFSIDGTGPMVSLIKLSPDGQQQWTRKQIMDGLHKISEATYVTAIAVDGPGNVYLLDRSQEQVFIFSPEGEFRDRFGSPGDGPGQLDSPDDIAIDGQGRIYISDSNGIQIFDAGGAFIKRLDRDIWPAGLMDLKLDLQGSLYLMSNKPQVLKYTVQFK